MAPTHLFVVDPVPEVREMFETFCSSTTDFVYVGSTSTLTECLSDFFALNPHIFFFQGGGTTIGEMATALRQRWPTARLVATLDKDDLPSMTDFVTTPLDGAIFRYEFDLALIAGLRALALGHRWASPGVLEWFYQAASAAQPTTDAVGKPVDKLSPREWQMLTMLAEGKANKEIAALLHISVNTVEHHMSKLHHKLGVSSRTEAAKWYWERGRQQEK